MIAGVDGCKDKWIAVVDLGDGRTEIRSRCEFRNICENRELNLIVIDVPIGLVDEGHRQADAEAREFLGKRACCVFTSPIRPILSCEAWDEGRRIRSKVERKKISKQQFGILSKVREVDTVLRETAASNVYEGHPEVTFAVMNGTLALISKRTVEGQKKRSESVSRYFPDASLRMSEYRYHREDILDAYALLWTARRIQLGQQRRFPKSPEVDRFGRRMEIAA